MSKTAKIIFALYPGVEALDITGPAGVFTQVNSLLGQTCYEITYCSLIDKVGITASCGLNIVTTNFDQLPQRFSMLIVPGADHQHLDDVIENKRAISRLQQLGERCSGYVTSVCTGAFLLAESGFLDNKKVNTHWAYAQELQKRYSTLHVKDDGLYVQDGNTWTSAGVISGIDMALAMVTKDVGSNIALKVAQSLVVHLVRYGKQSQFSTPLALQTQAQGQTVLGLISYLQTHLTANITVTDMADKLNMSERTLHRQCQETFGKGPGKLLNELKLDYAKQLLSQTNKASKTIAIECGFSTPEALSKAFSNAFGTTPTQYRTNFQTA